MKLTIEDLRGLEILDSRGRPTVAVWARLSNGATAWAQVPSGASTGRHEALELRDGDASRYVGKGVQKAAGHVGGELRRALAGREAEDQEGLDRAMMELDGTANKSRLGANAILGVSCAVARAVALSRGIPLWEHLSAAGGKPQVPVPMVNILSGGLHAGGNLEFQDFLAIPHGFGAYAEALAAVVAVHGAAHRVLGARGFPLTGVADEGGWGPPLESNEQALEILTEAIGEAGYDPGGQISIAIDVASTHFYQDGAYHLRTERRALTSAEMTELLAGWCGKYPIVSIEDGLHEDDWDGWQNLTKRLGSRVQLVGDDFFTTRPERVRRGIAEKAANAVLVKMNQIGTLTETFEVIRLAREAGWKAVISARSGETEDWFLADLAVASGAGQIKIGSITRGERLAKYNRLLEIEAESGLQYPGGAVILR
ncbi:MAG: phosphopyruvate hydratase [Acidimicrobiia bacterium]|nr:phosphopyruvate hydratase [Acidimicrobiia bacterium]